MNLNSALMQGQRQLPQSGATEGPSLRGCGVLPQKILEFSCQILHSGRLPVQNHTSRLFLPGFGRSTLTDFLRSWYGHGRTGRTSGAGPVMNISQRVKHSLSGPPEAVLDWSGSIVAVHTVCVWTWRVHMPSSVVNMSWWPKVGREIT